MLIWLGLAVSAVFLPPDRLAALPAFARSIAPFPVVDSAGRAYDMPFLGGLDTPRPTLADIDGDGDLDLFIQEFSGSLMFFEQTAPGRFAWRADRYLDLDIGEWYRFADLDGDGDLDLMSELPFSYLRWWRNDGGPRAARFTALPDSVRGTDGRPIFADRQNIAQLGDVDCDGKVDLLIGRVQGSVTRYELADFDSSGAPRFRLITDRFEDIEIVGQMVPGMTNPNPTMHGANTMALADLDGDGDQDLLWGDFFEPGLLLIENTGSCRELNLHGTPVSWPASAPIRTSGYNAPTVGDLDGDHSLDVLVGVLGGAFNPTTTAANNLLHLARTPAGWTLRTRRFLGTVDIGNESWPALADIDGDGDLDVLMANRIEGDDQSTGAMYLLTNTGTARAPAFRESGKVANINGFQSAPAIADLDGDGDLDMITGSYGPALSFWRNDGTRAAPRFVLADSAVARIPRGSSTVPALADLDGDGDLDLVVGEAAGNLNVFTNTGSRTAPRFELAGERWQGVDATRRSAPTFADLDADGDMDLVVGAADGTLRAWRNDGPATAPVFTDAGVLVPPTRPYATPALGDLDGDRVPDLISGASGGGLLFFSGRRGG